MQSSGGCFCVCDIVLPNKEIPIKSKHLETPWLTNATQKSTKRKRLLYKKFLKRRAIENKSNYTEVAVRRCFSK